MSNENKQKNQEIEQKHEGKNHMPATEAPRQSRAQRDPKILAVNASTGFSFDNPVDKKQVSQLFSDIEEDIKLIKSGDLSFIEETLYCQSVALQKVFHKTLNYCMASSQPKHKAIYGKLALKAQSQCRSTLMNLAELKHPKRTMFIKQQNNAINQQVNNNPE